MATLHTHKYTGVPAKKRGFHYNRGDRASYVAGLDNSNEGSWNPEIGTLGTTILIESGPFPKGEASFQNPVQRRQETKFGSALTWDPDRAYLGLKVIEHRSLLPLRRKWPEAYANASLMLERLEFQKRMYKGDFPDPYSLVGDSILFGPKFQADYDAAWKLARLQWMGIEFITPPPSIGRYEGRFKMTSFDSMYHPRFFIFWDEEVLDYKEMFETGWDPDPDTLSELFDIATALSEELYSDEEMKEEVPLSYIYSPTSSSGYSVDDYRTCPEWEIEFSQKGHDGEEDVLIGRRSLAPKRPGEIRDIGVLTPESARRFKRITYHLAKAVKRIHRCPYGKTSDFLNSTLEWIGDPGWWYMRDYEKCGLTVPHGVIETVMRGFYFRRPDLADMAAKFYKGIQCHINNGDRTEIKRPVRGHFLGYWTEGMTFLQYCIHRLVSSRLGISSRRIRYAAVNDDMVASCDDYDILSTYVEEDSVVNSLLALPYKETKSGISSAGFIFCEEYVHRWHVEPKSSLVALGILGAKRCINIAHAKNYVHAILSSRPMMDSPIQEALRDVISYWGYEFYPEEGTQPYLFGGWVPCIKEGLDVSYDYFKADLRHQAAYWAVQSRLVNSRTYQKKPSMALSRHLNLQLWETPDDRFEELDLALLFGTRKTLMRLFRRATTSWKQIADEYERLLAKRASVYSHIETPWRIQPIEVGWLERHPDSVIRPNMPGIKFAPTSLYWEKPILGMKIPSQDAWLHYLALEGYINFPNSGQFSAVERDMIKHKVYHFPIDNPIWLSAKGISIKACTLKLKGLNALALEYGLVPISIGDSDCNYWEVSVAAALNVPIRFVWNLRKYFPDVTNPLHVEDVLREFIDMLLSEKEESESAASFDDNQGPFTAADVAMWTQYWDMLADHPEERMSSYLRSVQTVTSDQREIDDLLAQITGAPRSSQGNSAGSSPGLFPTDHNATGDSSEVEDVWAEFGL